MFSVIFKCVYVTRVKFCIEMGNYNKRKLIKKYAPHRFENIMSGALFILFAKYSPVFGAKSIGV